MQQFLEFVHAVETDICTGSQVRGGSDFFENFHDAEGSAEQKSGPIPEEEKADNTQNTEGSNNRGTTRIFPEDGIQLGHLYRAKEQKKVESSNPLQDSPAADEQVSAPVSGVCTKLQTFITSIKQALAHLFEVGLTPIAIMVSTIVMLFVWPKSSGFDEDTCIASNEGNDFMMIVTLVETCDCVKTELEDAYLNVSRPLLRCMCGG